MTRLKNYALILASGTGNRFNSDIPKQFVKIGEKTIIEHAIEAFEKVAEIDEIFVVITPEFRQKADEILKINNYKKVTKLLDGGKIRKESSYIAINSIEEKEANVLIHDCARPFVSEEIIKNCIKALENNNAVGVAVSTTDTIIEMNGNFIKNIPNRSNLKCIQTPQCFKLTLIRKAHELAKDDSNFTDDCGLVIKYDLDRIFIVDGSYENFKITYPQDYYLAENVLNNKI